MASDSALMIAVGLSMTNVDSTTPRIDNILQVFHQEMTSLLRVAASDEGDVVCQQREIDEQGSRRVSPNCLHRLVHVPTEAKPTACLDISPTLNNRLANETAEAEGVLW